MHIVQYLRHNVYIDKILKIGDITAFHLGKIKKTAFK